MSSKNTINNKNRYGFWITYNLVDALPLSDEAHRLYTHLIAISNNGDLTSDDLDDQLSVRGLAARLRWRPAKTIKARRELVAFGLIEIVANGRGRCDETIIVDLSDRNSAYMKTKTDPQIDNPPAPSSWEPQKKEAKGVDEIDNTTPPVVGQSVAESDNTTVAKNDNTTKGENHGINIEKPKEPFSLSEKRKAQPKKAQVDSSVSGESEITAKHPAIALVHTLMRFYPHKTLWPDLVKVLGEHPDETKAADCYKAWLTRGFNKMAVTPFTDWYRNGIPQYQAPQRKQFTRPQDQESRIAAALNF